MPYSVTENGYFAASHPLLVESFAATMNVGRLELQLADWVVTDVDPRTVMHEPT
ncbi:hypothetical protein SAMN04488550_2635 [Gordonia malaquae]|uniref:hypothetical protein n=1 Tax=Gordonia malaquae TaxID=410332 RepID=UPI00089CC8B8|nr:hypothetical protein [Gordonia malaquae]SED50427.1 hypothetical protein SAMN04488550_2635 [Gordonia malaquae]